MRKIIVLLCTVSFYLFLSSCNYDSHYGKRPFDYGDALWVCDEPSAWFMINHELEDYYYPKGEVTINNQTVPFKLSFVPQTNIVFFRVNNTDNGGFDGECEFSPQQLVIKIDKETDTLFNGQYDELIFTRNQDTSSLSEHQ